MKEHEERENLPQAYGLALWLRDLGCGEEQIASVLSIEPEAVPGLIKLASMKLARLRREAGDGSSRPAGLAVFVDVDNVLLDRVAEIAHKQSSVLHLVALHRTVKCRSFGIDSEQMRLGGLMRREAEEHLLLAARRAMAKGVDVVPHALPGPPRDAIRKIVEIWGPTLFVIREDHRLRNEIERATKKAGGSVLVLDDVGQMTRAVPRPTVIQRLALGRAH